MTQWLMYLTDFGDPLFAETCMTRWWLHQGQLALMCQQKSHPASGYVSDLKWGCRTLKAVSCILFSYIVDWSYCLSLTFQLEHACEVLAFVL